MNTLIVFVSVLGFTSVACDMICTDLYDPVCGYSPDKGFKNFSSPCQLNAQNNCYNTNYSIEYKGLCGEAVRYNETCDFVCVVTDEPVCGFDSCRHRKNFTSLCELDMENTCAGTDFVVNNVGACEEVETVKHCDMFCPDVYNPVCGYDPCIGYKDFTSPCWLIVENRCYNTSYQEGSGCGV